MKPIGLFCYMFFGPEGAQRSIAFLAFLFVLTNKNVALIHSVTIYQKKTKDCSPSGSFQHKLQDRCFL